MYNVINSKYKTVMCRHYERTGICHLGERCHYAHGQTELRKMTDPIPFDSSRPASLIGISPSSHQMQSPTHLQSPTVVSPVPIRGAPVPPNYKTVQCRYYSMTGFCKFGDLCTFAHGDGDIRSPSQRDPYKGGVIGRSKLTSDPSTQAYLTQLQLIEIINNLEYFYRDHEGYRKRLKEARELTIAGNFNVAGETINEIVYRKEASQGEKEQYEKILGLAMALGQESLQKILQMKREQPGSLALSISTGKEGRLQE
eukprot:TRINITY_DN4917_c0_g1_i6.p1 TRINITY_DN4917_c0_g1~~TRINITY_DN4917_c0_g1_i6.p1  ORF type:complete len:255 (+),score=27.65 TRINITY_DN4917_c0_g1_i6:122-886(+)